MRGNNQFTPKGCQNCISRLVAYTVVAKLLGFKLGNREGLVCK